MEKVQRSKFEVDKFNENNKFELWKINMWDLLLQQGLQKVLVRKTKKLVSMIDGEWEDLDAITLNTVRLCLEDEVMFNIVGEETTIGLWNRLENLYIENSLTNRTYPKR